MEQGFQPCIGRLLQVAGFSRWGTSRIRPTPISPLLPSSAVAKEEVHHRYDREQGKQETQDGPRVASFAGDGRVTAGVQRKVATDSIPWLKRRRILRIGEERFGRSGGEGDAFVHLDVYVPGALLGERLR